MFLYSAILFITSVLFIALGICVYKGHAELIHSYHQENVIDKNGYCKAMGKALIIFALPLIASGVIAFFTESALPVIVLLIGITGGFIPIIKTQNKYNGGMF